jgi:hypothetical protein
MLLEEMVRIFPEGIIMATGFYALLTLSFPFAVFAGSMVEASLVLRAFQYAAQFLNLVPTALQTERQAVQCRSGFRTVTMEAYSLFPAEYQRAFPSAQLYMIAAAASYIINSLSSQSKELEALGAAWSSRYYMSLMFSLLLLIVFFIFRLYYSCDSIWSGLLSMVLGLAAGGLLVMQNEAIFGDYGKQSINLLGIPLLANRASNGQTLYLCPTTVKD